MSVTIFDVEVKEKRVLYRVDYNVPLKEGIVLDDYRIKRTIPTLDYLLKNQAKVILLSHLGRPGGKYDPKLSLRPVAQHLMSYFDQVNVQVTDAIFGETILQSLATIRPGSIFVLGNTRFFPQEEAADFTFAKDIARMGDLYVSDAFGAMHRNDSTVTQLPRLLESYPGALLQEEVSALSRLRDHPQKPLTVIIGGAKMETKIDLLRKLITRADYILVGGAIANTFAKALGQDVGGSFVEDNLLPAAREIVQQAGSRLILPLDYVIEGRGEKFRYVDIGNKTVALWLPYINGSRELFWNGTMGIAEEARFANGSLAIAQALVAAKGITTVAGGDTVSFVEQHKLTDKFSFVSTGGGAALAFITGADLPGLKALNMAV